METCKSLCQMALNSPVFFQLKLSRIKEDIERFIYAHQNIFKIYDEHEYWAIINNVKMNKNLKFDKELHVIFYQILLCYQVKQFILYILPVNLFN